LFGFLRKKSFRELMDEYEKAYGDSSKRLKILQEAAKVAKTDVEKLELVTTWNEFKEQQGA